MHQLPERLKTLRKSKKIYQKDLSKLLNITIRQYQRYENGEQKPNINSLLALADFFDTSVDYLLGRTDNLK